MPAPYSYDLRKKAIEAVKRGQRKTDVCRLLKISRNSLDLWLKRVSETGDVRPSIPSNKGTPWKIKDEEKFREFVRENLDKTQGKMAEIWYLPAYSPDLNKIENWWAVLKTWMKQRLAEFDTVRECVDSAFRNCPNLFA